ncbi:hypothetical protein K438DRAFT_1977321 [Mycena galopus ATCC 62051]|nr:hypothetical protein K438DRAFT_1977321 [Mycena galopus ATCC 62051]
MEDHSVYCTDDHDLLFDTASPNRDVFGEPGSSPPSRGGPHRGRRGKCAVQDRRSREQDRSRSRTSHSHRRSVNRRYQLSPSPSARYATRAPSFPHRQGSRSRSPRGRSGKRVQSLASEERSGSDVGSFDEFREIRPLVYPRDTLPEGNRERPSANLTASREPESASSLMDWTVYPRSEAITIQNLRAWRARVLEEDPVYPPYNGIRWNLKWLKQSILSSRDPRSIWRMKTITALDPHVLDIGDLLERAIRFGMPFSVYVQGSRVREFRDILIPSLVLKTAAALYEPGYIDAQLTWPKQGGNVACYTAYVARIGEMLKRPHSPAFIPHGGVLRYVAELYDQEVVQRFAQGPTLQVSQFAKGEWRLFRAQSEESFWTTDRVTESEIGLLIGRIPGENGDSERSLWPSPDTFERECRHMRGYLSRGAYRMLNLIKDEIFGYPPSPNWRDAVGWKEFFRSGRTTISKHSTPMKADWDVGRSLFSRSYPSDWDGIEMSQIIFPETFVQERNTDTDAAL